MDVVYVATDCKEIMDCVKTFNFSKVKLYERDSLNAQDRSSTESVMMEFLSKHPQANNDLFLLVQATNPFLTSVNVNEAIALLQSSKADSLLSCCLSKRFFWNKDGTPLNYDFRKRLRRQDYQGLFMENGALYVNTVGNVLRDQNRLSGSIAVYEMEEFTGYELDEPHDWVICESLMNELILKDKAPDYSNIKIVMTDVDGVLTDAGMYYGEHGEEYKKFNTQDGRGFEILRMNGIKTAIITSENTSIVERRAKKIKADFLYQGVQDKLSIAKEICTLCGFTLDQVAYIGDDVNDLDLLLNAGLAACPANAVEKIKSVPKILKLQSQGGEGAFREVVNMVCRAK